VNYEEIKELSKELGRPANTLIALTDSNDPFYLPPGRVAKAEWFVKVRHLLNIPDGYHKRRIHYLLVSQPEARRKGDLKMSSGGPCENTDNCWVELCRATQDAIILELIPADAFVDNRTDAPVIHLIEPEDASIGIENGWPGFFDLQMPDLPALTLDRPKVPQPYHIEIWAEKTTMNDILIPLAQEFKLNLVTGAGEMSATACRDLVNRAEESDRPVRLLYISDFDPAGQSMPLAVARKIEHELHRRDLDLDIQVRPIALTHDQCVEYRLPRVPIKEKEKRAAAFEERFGSGATELDALEALHPGILRQLLIKEIERYWNPDHDDAVARTCEDIDQEVSEITGEVIEEHRHEIDALAAEWKEIAKAYRAWIELAKPVWRAISEKLGENAPDIDGVDRVPDFDADEDTDPLFDSSRDYVEQIDRYKRHQDKPTEARVRQGNCLACGKAFETKRSDKRVCSTACNTRLNRQRKTSAGSQAKPEKYDIKPDGAGASP
jgi:hypothetical protein